MPPAFVFTDHNFPATTQVGEDGECLKIFRIEHGTLLELVSAFMEAVKGFDLPAGTVLVLCSLDQLVSEGPGKYADSFRHASLRLKSSFGDGLIVVHGVPVNVATMEAEAVRA